MSDLRPICLLFIALSRTTSIFHSQLGGKIILILGRRGSGKTAWAGKIGEYMLVRRRMPIYWVGLPTQARSFLPHWITMADSPEQCPIGCIIIIDESGLNYLSLAFATERNKLLRSLMMICRHKYILLVFAGQNSRDIDLSIIRQADCLIFKEPGAFQFDTERPDLKRRAKIAAEAFRGIPQEERKEAAYVFNDAFQGIIKSTLPSFWSESFSKIYANFDFPAIREQTAKGREIQEQMVEETKLLNEASQEKNILELRRQGYGIEKIAKTLGISTWAFRKCLNRCE